MEFDQLKTELRGVIVEQALDGQGADFTDTTPLVELGIIDSMTVQVVINHIEANYGVLVPSEALTPENLRDISSIATLVLRLREQAETSP